MATVKVQGPALVSAAGRALAAPESARAALAEALASAPGLGSAQESVLGLLLQTCRITFRIAIVWLAGSGLQKPVAGNYQELLGNRTLAVEIAKRDSA